MSELIQHIKGPTVTLPFELLETIVHNLDSQDDLSALIACTYASRTLWNIAQKQLFHTIAFSYKITLRKGLRRHYYIYEDENLSFNFPNLLRVFKEFPQLLDSVRELRFLFIQLSDGETIPDNPVIAQMEQALQLLPQMNNLRHISFPGAGKNVSAGNCLHWTSVPPPLKTFFLEFFKSKSCTSLDLRGILSFPTQHLSQLPSVRSLAWLTPATREISAHNQCADPGQGSRIFLRTLELGTVNEMRRRRRKEYDSHWIKTLRWLQAPTCELNLENLKSLAMPVFSPPEGAYADDASQFFALCYASLESLTFRTLHSIHQRHRFIGADTKVDDYLTKPPDLSGLHCLNSLSIYTSIASSRQPGLFKNPIPWIIDLLKSLSHAPCFANHFRTLCLHVELHDFPQDRLGGAGLMAVQDFLKEQSEGRPRKTLDVIFYSVDEDGLRERISLEPLVWDKLF